MKIWEILKEENVGKTYKMIDIYNDVLTVVIEEESGGGLTVVTTESGEYLDDIVNLHGILTSDFKEYVVWSKVPVDTKILVRNHDGNEWSRRYFAKYENGKVCAWTHGRISWSANNEDDTTAWNEAKLYEGNEA